MPGYDLEINGEYARLDSLLCPSCNLILRDAIQTEEGVRLCKTCCDTILSSPNTTSKSGLKLEPNEPIHPDIAVRREVERLPVKCANHKSGCPWTGKLKDHEQSHKHECTYKTEICPNRCGKHIPIDQMQEHLETECQLRQIQCPHCKTSLYARDYENHQFNCIKAPYHCEWCDKDMAKIEMDKHKLVECGIVAECVGCSQQIHKDSSKKPNISIHLQKPEDIFLHNQREGLRLRLLERKVKAQEAILDDIQIEIDKGRESINNLETVSFEEKKQLEQLKTDHNEQVIDLKRKISELEIRTEKQGQVINSLQRSGGSSFYPPSNQSSYDDFQSNDRLIQLETKIAEQERLSGMLKVHISELELQLQASLASTYNGSFLWRIPDIRRRRRDAIDGKITSIYSPPFYTGRNGYKMCIRAYLNGDGIGYNTHVSIFFVLMKGEYDPLLKWPFDYKVSLIMVDQDHRRHIVQTFKPSPSSSSFQRPKTDMNIASGCPKFAELKVLDNDSYVKDDVMYIKCIVDTTRIFHP